MKIIKWVVKWTGVAFISLFILIFLCDISISIFSKNRLYKSAEDIPVNRVGLLLGIPKFSQNKVTPFYIYRIQAAKELFEHQKISILLISGDDGKNHFNETKHMRQDLIKAGVDSNCIFIDPHGYRTYNSMYRAKHVYHLDTITVISQAFHNERAVFLASQFNLYAIGYDAKDCTGFMNYKAQLREKLARVKVFIDLWLEYQVYGSEQKITLPVSK